MKIVIAGAGFLGAPLAASLGADRHDVVVLTRHAGSTRAGARAVEWAPDGNAGAWAREIDGADAVVNLAGESIAGRRWSAQQKQQILDSRLRATESLVAAIDSASRPPRTFLSGSAVGFYGPHGAEIVTEDTPAGSDFLASVCTRWESAASRASSSRTRVVRLRTGLVLALGGGALPPMLPPFKVGLGGPVGSGLQYWPWIHRDEWIAMVRWACDNDRVVGALNVTAPDPVPNAEFARALGRALHRPAFMPAPAFALRILLGEMADGLLLSGQRAVPAKAEGLGFTFKHRRLDSALGAIFGGARS